MVTTIQLIEQELNKVQTRKDALSRNIDEAKTRYDECSTYLWSLQGLLDTVKRQDETNNRDQ